MKKKRFMGLLTLASCVTLLTGCESDALFGLGGKWNSFIDWGKGVLGLKKDEPKEEKKSEDEPEQEETPVEPQQPEVSLSVLPLPEKLTVGEELDLDNYVTVSGTNEQYTVKLDAGSANYATVSGSVIEVKAEGEISFTVSVAGKSQHCSFGGMSVVRSILTSSLGDIEKNYTVLQLGESGVSGSFVHSDQYLVVDDDWGFLSFAPRYSYQFEFDDNGEIEVDPEVMSETIIDTYNSKFNVDFSKAELGYSNIYKDEVLVIYGDAAAAFAENSMLAYDGVWTFYTDESHTSTVDLSCDYVEFYYQDIGSAAEPSYAADAIIYTVSEGALEPLFEIIITDDPRYVGDEELDEFVADPDNIPAGGDYQSQLEIPEFFSKDIPDEKAAMVVYTYGWYNDYKNEDGAWTTEPSSTAGTIFEGNLPDGGSSRIMTENGILNLDGYLDPTGGVIQRTEVINEEQVKKVYDVEPVGDSFALYENAQLQDVYDDEVLSLSNFGGDDMWSSDSLLYLGAANSGTQNLMFAFQFNKYRQDALMDALCSSEEGLNALLPIFAEYESRGIRNFFTGYLYYAPYLGQLQLRFELSWDDLADDPETTDFDESGESKYVFQVMIYNGVDTDTTDYADGIIESLFEAHDAAAAQD